MNGFEKLLGKDSPLFKAINDRGFDTPSEIQEKTIPTILKGKDIIAIASTGSGKTLAFAAALIKNAKSGFGVQGLVLTPTRELAEQVAKELRDFAKYKELHVAAVYGGESFPRQEKALKDADIVVATPGRMLDHIKNKTINMEHINTLVLDEADRMLDMGFRDDVGKIIGYCSGDRQTLLFSATTSGDVYRLAERYMYGPKEISATPLVDPKKLLQVFYDVGKHQKYSLLVNLLEDEKSELVMIFCNTRDNVDFVANNLKALGIEALAIHGGFSQDKRNKVIAQFHGKKLHVLVATDVAARGLDIKGISHVYNYDIPANEKEYTHRIGRTARAGKEGKVINIVSQRDYDNFRNVNQGEFKIEQLPLPEIRRAQMKWMPKPRGRGPNRGRSRNFGSRDNTRSNYRDHRNRKKPFSARNSRPDIKKKTYKRSPRR